MGCPDDDRSTNLNTKELATAASWVKKVGGRQEVEIFTQQYY